METTSTVVHNLPRQTTSFIGRQQEIVDIIALLDNPDCQLLTLVGPGGIGKTRLAIEVARHYLEADIRFPDGVFFVPLVSIRSPNMLVSTIAHVLDFQFYQSENQRYQLLDYLAERDLLLVLDNFEHVLEGMDLVDNILSIAPEVTVLVTSREVLHLQNEWVWDVHGMNFPEDDSVNEGGGFDAVTLFTERCRQVRRDFSEIDSPHEIIRICQLVEGMPLALELAASWSRILSLAVIADRIQTGLELLETQLRNVEDRHRSIHTVFAHSWRFLTEEERDVFQRLIVFRGGFTHEAASYVAGASLSVLLSLVDKSFVRTDPTGHYDIHELLRQYGEDQLIERPDVQVAARNAHCDYYADHMSGQFEQIAKGDFAIWRPELDNLRVAWQWAVNSHRFQAIIDLREVMLWVYKYLDLDDSEGREAFEYAASALDMEDPQGEQGIVLGQIQVMLINFSEDVRTQQLVDHGLALQQLYVVKTFRTQRAEK